MGIGWDIQGGVIYQNVVVCSLLFIQKGRVLTRFYFPCYFPLVCLDTAWIGYVTGYVTVDTGTDYSSDGDEEETGYHGIILDMRLSF